jgi:hypothetical protein
MRALHPSSAASRILDQLVDVVATLAVAPGALDAENVELALDVAEDEIGSGYLQAARTLPAPKKP